MQGDPSCWLLAFVDMKLKDVFKYEESLIYLFVDVNKATVITQPDGDHACL